MVATMKAELRSTRANNILLVGICDTCSSGLEAVKRVVNAFVMLMDSKTVSDFIEEGFSLQFSAFYSDYARIAVSKSQSIRRDY